MPVNVRIPTPLRKLTKDKDTVQATGATIHIGASKAAKFSAASALKKQLNP